MNVLIFSSATTCLPPCRTSFGYKTQSLLVPLGALFDKIPNCSRPRRPSPPLNTALPFTCEEAKSAIPSIMHIDNLNELIDITNKRV